MIRACWVPLCGVGLAYVIAGPIAAGEGREAPDAAAKGVRCLLPADLGWEVVECVQADELPALSLPSRPTALRPPSDEATFVVLTIRLSCPRERTAGGARVLHAVPG